MGLSTRRNAGAAFLVLAALAAVIPAAGAAGAAPRTTGPAASWRAAEVYPVAVSLDSTARSIKPGALYGLSCLSPGNCVAGGWYLRRTGPFGEFRPMTGTQSHRTWGPSRRLWLPSTTLDPDAGDAQQTPAISEIDGISCTGPRSCVAVGWYITRAPTSYVPIVVTESAGHWGRPPGFRHTCGPALTWPA
ncbi:MAG: hypothetical protein ACRDRJ_33625 [Streptosporangiaceae bacterium]